MSVNKKILSIFITIFIIVIYQSSLLYSHTSHRLLPVYRHSLKSTDNTIEPNYRSSSMNYYKKLKRELLTLHEAEKNKDIKIINHSLRKIIYLYSKSKNYNKLIEYAEKMKKYGIEYNNNSMIFHSNYSLGEAYFQLYRRTLALVNFINALKFIQDKSINISKEKVTYYKFQIYQYICFIYQDTNNFKESIFYAKATEMIAEKSNIPEAIYAAKYNLSNVYFAQKKYKKSIKILSTAFSEYKSPNSWNKYVYFLSLGTAYYNLEKYKQALFYLNKCLKHSSSDRYVHCLPIIYIGLTYVKKGNLTKAYTFLMKAQKLNISPINKGYAIKIDKGFYELFTAKQKFKKANKYLLSYVKLKEEEMRNVLKTSNRLQNNKYIDTQIPILKEDILYKNKKLHTDNILNILLLIISILILALLVLASFLYLSKKRHGKELILINNSLEDKVKERTKELRISFSKLRKEIETRKKVENEIKIAAEIQRSILPKITSKYQKPEFTLSAELEPAKDAAGDFYDFFYMADGRLALILADVSGKGITAAIFMTFAKTVLKNICQNEKDPSDALKKANNILATDNDQCMFVTVFLCYYNIETGEIIYANAGHHEAVILNDKSISTFGTSNNMALGVMENEEYSSESKKLSTGDSIICYTDGVTEAISPEVKEYGEKKLYKLLKKNRSLKPSELSNAIIKDVKDFEERNRFDDITVLIFKRNE
ncbi:MAG TPA: SpoIIE family protein phosphatase [Victivallales bacterium]|nr:SpoIIE family protein phosphatase [Victivallales bacterium]